MIDITGRDGFILCKALAYAIITIEKLPVAWREASDREDMIALLHAHSADPGFWLTTARAHIEQRRVTVENGQLELSDP